MESSELVNPCEKFLERKLQVFGALEKAPSTKMQGEYEEVLIHRRKINIGRFTKEWGSNPKEKEIAEAVFSNKVLGLNVWSPSSVISETHRRFRAVFDCASFKKMFDDLKTQKEFAIVLKTECSNDHSFIGMTTMIEITTWKVDYLIDVLPLNRFIMEDLKILLEDKKILKYIFDGDNDVLKLKRDFLINLVHACDVQILMQEILKSGQLEELLKNIPVEIKRPWYLQNIGNRHALILKSQLLQWEEKASEKPMSFETVRDLFYPETKFGNAEDEKEAVESKNQTRSESESPTVIEYNHSLHVAKNNANTLLSIVSFVKGNVPRDKKEMIFRAAYERTKFKLYKTFSPTFPPTFEAYSSSKNAITIPPQHLSLFRIIFNWRRYHAAIIDEYPTSMFTDKQLLDFIENKPKSIEEIASRLAVRKGLSNKSPEGECIASWSKILLGILQEGESHFNKLLTVECHRCRKKRGHYAWGCPEPPSNENNKSILKRLAHQRKLNKRTKT